MKKAAGLHFCRPAVFLCSFTLLASQKGFEPPTLRLGGARSIQLSY